jgi:hypothetical protein
MRSKTINKIHFALWALIATLALLSQVAPIDGIWFWLVIGVALLAETGLWWYTRPRYFDFVMDPLRREQLPRDIYATFDRWTPQFMALGCGLLGDFQLSYVPWPTYVRYFLPPDRRIRGEVSQSDETSSPSFVTVFDDGRAIETARMDPSGALAESTVPIGVPHLPTDPYSNPQIDALLESFVGLYFDRWLSAPTPPKENELQCRDDRMLWAQSAPGLSVSELYALHVRTVELYESTYGARGLTVVPDRLLDFAQYEHRLLWWQMRRLPSRYGVPQPPAGARSVASLTVAK